MKKIIYVLALSLAIVGCKEEAPKDYVTLSGTLVNQNSDSLIVAQRDILKTIRVDAQGQFSDTLKVKAGNYILFDGKNRIDVYLANGYDLKINVDTKELAETLKFSGNGEVANNYLSEKAALSEKLVNFGELMAMDTQSFDTKLNSIEKELKGALDNTKGLDSAFIASQIKETEGMKAQLKGMHEQKQVLKAFKGQDSPKFSDYENHAGGTTSLDDLKGKYVYIDMWATWCGPCIREIPSLKEVEKAYHGKNIEFVSISVDRKGAYETWKEMVVEKELGGIQLWAKEDQTFASAYKVSGIPRFILIDPQGKVVDADAPRPSDEKLKELFNTLSI